MNEWSELASELLPPRLQEFVRLIGLQATMAMVEVYGGTRIYVPAEARPDHPYVHLVGFDNLVKLCTEYGADGVGLRMTLPNAKRALIAIRNSRIRTEYQSKSARQLAAEYRVHERTVERIVSGSQPGDDSQVSLAF